MRLCFALLVFLFAPAVSAQGTGMIAGQVFDEDGITALIGANVRVDGTTLAAVTDIDGNYRIIGVPVGTYAVTASYTGYVQQTVAEVAVEGAQTRQLNFTLAHGWRRGEVCLCYEAPMFTNDAYNVRVLFGEDLMRMPINR
jgi:hypothetical protein